MSPMSRPDNELTIAWNKTTFLWNEETLTWNETTVFGVPASLRPRLRPRARVPAPPLDTAPA